MYDLDYLEITFRLLIAALIGSAIGFERESTHQAAGLRTNMLVCLASCILTIIQMEVSFFIMRLSLDNPDLQPILSTDFTRIPAQIVSGVGFLGAGAILITKSDMVMGLTTAATIWAVTGLGIAVGYGYYFLSALACIIMLLVLYALKKIVRTHEIFKLDIVLQNRDAIQSFNKLFKENHLKTSGEDFKMERTTDGYTYHVTYDVFIPPSFNRKDLIDEFLAVSDSIIKISFRE